MSTIDLRRLYADGDVLYAADLDAIIDDIETFLNTTKINDDNIQAAGITGSSKLIDGTVSTGKIADSAITTAKLNDSGVTTAKINDLAVTTAKLDALSVTTAKIATSNVTRAKLAQGAVASLTVASKTANYTATSDDDIILCSGSAFTVTLPTAVGIQGKRYFIKKTDSVATYSITIDGNGSQTIDGATTYVIYNPNEAITIMSDNANWVVIDRHFPTGVDCELSLDTGNGHGATNTVIRRYSNLRKDSLSPYATYADSAANGMNVTIDIPGLYQFDVTDSTAASSTPFGLSVNATLLTTSIASLSYSDGKRMINYSFGSSSPTHTSVVLRLAAGDVVRSHGNAQSDASSNSIFRCVRLGP